MRKGFPPQSPPAGYAPEKLLSEAWPTTSSGLCTAGTGEEGVVTGHMTVACNDLSACL